MEVPLNCLAYDEDLSALLDGELPPARAAQVRAHCATCARCAAELAALRVAHERVLSALRTAAPGEEARIARVEAQLRARLREEREIGTRRVELRPAPPPLRRQSRRRWIALAATGLAAAAALGLVLLFQARTPTRAVPAPAQEVAQTPPPVPPAPAPQEEPEATSREPEAVAELPAPKPAPVRPRPPASHVPLAEGVEPPVPSNEPEVDLAAADEEDVELASHLDMLEDFEVIQKLDLLEQLQKAEDGAGSG